VADSEIKEGPKGSYISWTWEILGKPNKVYDCMSLGNEISMKRLKTMAYSCGHPNPNFIADTEELHGKTCMIKLKIEKDESGQYEPKNKICGFKPINGKTTVAEHKSIKTPLTGSETTVEKARMPWEK
jgi:hypothetical protein